MKVHRPAASDMAKWKVVEKTKREWCEWEWSVGYLCYSRRWRYYKKYFRL